MYEETKSSIDWKGIFLKVVIAFLVVLIALQGIKMFKNEPKKQETTTQTIAETKSSTTFAANLDKLTEAGEKYFEKNKKKIPTTENTTVMVTLSDLINEGYITALTDENGKTCETKSSYVTAELENKRTKIKSNLVCGSSFNNAFVYLSENEGTTEEKTEVKNNDSKTETKKTYTYTSNNSNTKTENNSNTTNNTCKTNCGTPAANVKTEVDVEQKVVINEKPATKPEVQEQKPVVNEPQQTYYTVRFDSNGGATTYSSQKVLANKYAYNPGQTYINGYVFKGWYLDGEKFDFNTPITRNITLVARYTRDYDLDDDLYPYDEYDEYDRYNSTTSVVSYVYTLGWNKKNTQNISITHTLKVPTTLANNSNIDEVRIKKIEYSQPLNTMSLVNTYRQKHSQTFYYTKNGGEAYITSANNLATINKNAVWFDYDNDYIERRYAVNNGIDVTWQANYVSSQCRTTFDVTNTITGAYDNNLCGYGIVYKVTWEGSY